MCCRVSASYGWPLRHVVGFNNAMKVVVVVVPAYIGVVVVVVYAYCGLFPPC